MLQLGAGQARLDLAVAAGARFGEPLLPAPAAAARAPHEQFAPAQHVGGRLHQAVPVRVERGDPAPPPVPDFVEVVGGVRAVEGVRPVHSVVRRDGHPAQSPLVPEVPGLRGRREDPAFLRHGDVGPPVGGRGPLVRVADADADVEEVGAVREPEVDLEGEVAEAFPLPEAEHLAAVGGGDAGRVHGGAGEGGVAGGADVPLDAAGEPGAVECEVRGLQHRVAVKEFTVRGLVDEGGDSAAEGGEHGGAQPVVLDHEGVDAAGCAVSVVAVPDAGGQQAAERFVADLAGHVAGQFLAVPVVNAVCLVERTQWGQRVVGAQLRGGQRQYLTSDRRHDHHGTRQRVRWPGALPVRIPQRRGRPENPGAVRPGRRRVGRSTTWTEEWNSRWASSTRTG